MTAPEPAIVNLANRKEYPLLIDLAKTVFQRFTAKDFTEEGVDEFLRYLDALPHRPIFSHFVLMAMLNNELAGMMEVRDFSHISLFFVREEYQGCGVGKAALAEALNICLHRRPFLAELTVNSSPFAVEIYKKLGFSALGPMREKNGIRFTPMALAVHPN